MDNYNNLILMLKDKTTGFFDQTIGSYEINKNMEYVDKIYAAEDEDDINIYLTLTTEEIEEDWKYSGIFNLYNEELFDDKVSEWEELSGDYNPKWVLKIKYSEDAKLIENLLNEILELHVNEIQRIIPLINPEDYTEE